MENNLEKNLGKVRKELIETLRKLIMEKGKDFGDTYKEVYVYDSDNEVESKYIFINQYTDGYSVWSLMASKTSDEIFIHTDQETFRIDELYADDILEIAEHLACMSDEQIESCFKWGLN